MDEGLDRMLSLTAEIADELLRLKDEGVAASPRLKENICTLAELALGLEEEPSEPSESSEPSEPSEEVKSSLTTAELRRAFSINDIFLFRRELFLGSEQRFMSALEGIAALSSFAEVRKYVSETLGLNPKRRETRDFLETLSQFY